MHLYGIFKPQLVNRLQITKKCEMQLTNQGAVDYAPIIIQTNRRPRRTRMVYEVGAIDRPEGYIK